MPRRCVLGCTAKDVPLHTFPNPKKFPVIFKAWINILKITDVTDIEEIHRTKKICDRHFVHKDRNRCNRLNSLAIPSLFLNSQQNVQDIEPIPSSASQVVTTTPSSTNNVVTTANVSSSETQMVLADTSDLTLMSDKTKHINSASDKIIETALCFNDDDYVQEEPLQSEFEFSWQQPSAVVPDTEEIETAMEADLYDVDANTMTHVALHKTGRDGGTATGHEGYRCNECDGEIHGFRYTCVQCADYDLCSACEARGAHARHYVLRVPGPRPHGELQAVLRTIRRALLSDSIVHVAGAHHDALVEVKEEPEDPIRVDEVPPGDVVCTRRSFTAKLTDTYDDLDRPRDDVTESYDHVGKPKDNVEIQQTTAKQIKVPDYCLSKEFHPSRVPESRPRKRTVQAPLSMSYMDLKSKTIVTAADGKQTNKVTSLTQPVMRRLHSTVALPEHTKKKCKLRKKRLH